MSPNEQGNKHVTNKIALKQRYNVVTLYQRDNQIIAYQVPLLSRRYFSFIRTECPRGTAAAVSAKNSPPDCFLNAATILKEIIYPEWVYLSKATKNLVNIAFARFSFYLKSTLRTAQKLTVAPIQHPLISEA